MGVLLSPVFLRLSEKKEFSSFSHNSSVERRVRARSFFHVFTLLCVCVVSNKIQCDSRMGAARITFGFELIAAKEAMTQQPFRRRES